jgi:hypothetical protein
LWVRLWPRLKVDASVLVSEGPAPGALAKFLGQWGLRAAVVSLRVVSRSWMVITATLCGFSGVVHVDFIASGGQLAVLA